MLYPTGLSMTYSRLQSLYKTYGSNGVLNLYAEWEDGDIPICTVTVGEGITITGTSKPITDNGNGTYTMELYTRLNLEWDTERYNLETSGVGDFTDWADYGSNVQKYVLIYDEVASLTLEPKQ